FGVLGGAYVNRLDDLPARAEFLLSGGTTLGVLALVLTAVIPAWRLRARVRPTLRFPPGVGARVPLARVFESHSAAAASALAVALAAFAPALIGYGLSANLSRVLYARGRNRATALAVGAGWLLVIVADLLIVPFVPRPRVVPALGLGTSIGLT